ncbi:4'-phosphopantetheinyl transferase family protein [Sinosporangium siamense]|uniref:4'-phosphopantetheinyl transferase n=1 Tax=Sinosporangium siamense TaxID=1367973 RepID=A0A919VAX5_9ACTN|nr:4'-phosphopantetheinyl transferase superfamily protein [Sinosporangium siamense]GII96961.1 4'-phosphopantetheinyl transferase [Sinosporangium siamense]
MTGPVPGETVRESSPAGLLGALLPSAAASYELFHDAVDPDLHPEARLFPDEEAAIARAVERRRHEFVTVRVCARRALATLGFGPVPVVPGEARAPIWPPGIVGSMTHCKGYRACVVAWDHELATVGIDAEPAGPLPDGVLEAVSLPEERTRIKRLKAADATVPWEKLLFSAKEAVYKAWFPLQRRWLGFEEADIAFHPDGTFSARLLVPGPVVGGETLPGFTGRWLAGQGLVLTVIAHPAPG